jgi:hypothetical protein
MKAGRTICNLFKKIINFFNIHIEDLNYSSQQFSRTANQVHQKYWWKNVTVRISFHFKQEFFQFF